MPHTQRGGRFGGDRDSRPGPVDASRKYFNLMGGVTQPRPGRRAGRTWGRRDSQGVGFPDPGKSLGGASQPLESGLAFSRRMRPRILKNHAGSRRIPGLAFGFCFLPIPRYPPRLIQRPRGLTFTCFGASHGGGRDAWLLSLAPSSVPTLPRPSLCP